MGTICNRRLEMLNMLNGLGNNGLHVTVEMTNEEILERVRKNISESAYPELFRKKFGSEWISFEDSWFSVDGRVINRYKQAPEDGLFIIHKREVPRRGRVLETTVFRFEDLFEPATSESIEDAEDI